ncbi:MAG: hemolysin III family protein [Deltaproteobacteria bacterium]|nr:hemolysin III family protein [Deltaproteobacteria bacterium]
MAFLTRPLSERKLSKDKSIHVTDEVYSTFISMTGALLSILGSTVLVITALATNKGWPVVGFTIYGLTLTNLFVSSALHHGIDSTEKVESILREFDYYSIFILIAGTFTPFCLILLRNNTGWILLSTVWAAALIGIFLKVIRPNIPKWFLVVYYTVMGWISVPLLPAILRETGWKGIFGLILGGFFFMIGSLFFALEKPNPWPGRFGFHEIWHLFVLGGTASHFLTIYLTLLPLMGAP